MRAQKIIEIDRKLKIHPRKTSTLEGPPQFRDPDQRLFQRLV
jgi:hypothetical protein